MKSKLRKRIIAMMLCLAMLLNGNVSVLADEGETVGTINTVESEVLEETAENAEDEIDALVEADDENVDDLLGESEETVEEIIEDEVIEEVVEEEIVEDEVIEEVVEEETTEEKKHEDVADIVVKEIQTFIWNEDGVTVEVTEKVIGAIPEGSQLSVTPIIEGEEYKVVETQLQEKAEGEDYEIAGFLAYDICFVDVEGNEIEPNDNVNVSILYDEAVIPEMDVEKDAELGVTVMHFEEDKNGEVAKIVDMIAEEEIEAAVTTTEAAEVEKVEFVTDSFSAFTIIWTSGNREKNFTVNTWTNNSWQRLDTDLDGEEFEIQTGTTINLLTDSRFVATADGTTYKVAFGTLQNASGGDVSERITTLKVSYSSSSRTWSYECELTDGTIVTYRDSSITGLALFYDVDTSDSGDYDTGDTYTVYVYVGSYTDTTKTEVISDECLELLGIDKSTIDGNGYFPVGEIQIAKSLIDSKGNAANIGGRPLITSEADWQAVLAALGELDTTTLIDERGVSYSKNINNKVGEYLDQAAGDINYTWGTMKTALFRWNDSEHYGFAGSNTGIKYHLDLRFNTNKITFITGNNGIASGVAKDGTTVDSRTYITGSEIQEPRNLNIPEGYRFAGYFEDADFTKEWNGIGTPLNEDQIVYIRIVEEDHVVLFYKVAQGEGSVSRDMDDFNPITGFPEGSVATPDTNYVFDGWYSDEACTNLISSNEEYIPEKPADGWESIDETTYWAKFILPTTTHLVEKVWLDDVNAGVEGASRPDSIKVQLYANEIATGNPVEIKADDDGNWKYTFTNLPLVDENNKEITYTARESSLGDYAVTYDNSTDGKTIITNTQLISISVTKIWDDLNDKYELRPDEIEVVLKGDLKNEPYLELNSDNSWTGTFELVSKYDSTGKLITYRVEEVSVTGYTTSYSGFDSNDPYSVSITNTLDGQLIKLIKVSTTNDSTTLADAKFKLEKVVTNESGVSYEIIENAITSSETGIIFDSKLPYGTYRLTELQAPAGYMLLETPYYIEINESGISYWIDNATTKVEATEEESGAYKINIANAPLYELPSTGGLGIYVYMLGGIMLMAFATFVLYKNRRKEVLAR